MIEEIADKFKESCRFCKSSEIKSPLISQVIDMEHSFGYALNLALLAVSCTFLVSLLYVFFADRRRVFWKLIQYITKHTQSFLANTIEKFNTAKRGEEVPEDYEEEKEEVKEEEAPTFVNDEIFHDINEESKPEKADQVTQTQEIVVGEHYEINEANPVNMNYNENVSPDGDFEVSNNSSVENRTEYYNNSVPKTRGRWYNYNNAAYNSRQQWSAEDLGGYIKNRTYSNIPKWGGKNPQEHEKRGGIFKQRRRQREQRTNEFQNGQGPVYYQYGTPWSVESAQNYVENSYYEGIDMNEAKSVEMQNPTL